MLIKKKKPSMKNASGSADAKFGEANLPSKMGELAAEQILSSLISNYLQSLLWK